MSFLLCHFPSKSSYQYTGIQSKLENEIQVELISYSIAYGQICSLSIKTLPNYQQYFQQQNPIIIDNNPMSQKQLLLDRYEQLHIIKQTQTKQIVSLFNRNTGQKAIAKIQPASILTHTKIRNVLHQATFVQSMQGYRGIPSMIWSGKVKNDRIVLLIEQLGDTLLHRFTLCNNKFSAKTVCMLGIQLLQILKNLHDKGYTHENISIDIFQFGRANKSQNIYINNLISCHTYRDPHTMIHVKQPSGRYQRSAKSIFQSGSLYMNKSKSRKDDIESVLLILVYLLKGELPWSRNFQRESKYVQPTAQFLKMFADTKLICEGVPKVFEDILTDCRQLKWSQQPHYYWYILKLKSYLYINGQEHDFLYDWIINKQYTTKLITKNRIPSIHIDKDQEYFLVLEECVYPLINDDDDDEDDQIPSPSSNKPQNPKPQPPQSPTQHSSTITSKPTQNPNNEPNTQIKTSNNQNQQHNNEKKQSHKKKQTKNDLLQRKKIMQKQCDIM